MFCRRTNVALVSVAWSLLVAIQAFGSGTAQDSQVSQEENVRISHTHPAMGVKFQIVFFANQKDSVRIIKHVCDRIDEIERIFSDYQRDSSVNRLCRLAPHPKFQCVEPELWHLCQLSKRISCETGGAFDCTLGKLSHVWRMARKRNRLPNPKKVSVALQHSGHRHLVIGCPNQVQLNTEVQLDFGGIAKGYAADESLKVLESFGVESALVDASGDIVVSNPPPGKSGWAVQIKTRQSAQKRSDPPNENFSVLELKNQAVATSGDLNQFLVVGGVRYSHIISPTTGQAVSQVSAVTVIAPNGTLADAYASAITVMLAKKGIEFANSKQGVETRVEYRGEDGRIETAVSDGWPIKH